MEFRKLAFERIHYIEDQTRKCIVFEARKHPDYKADEAVLGHSPAQ